MLSRKNRLNFRLSDHRALFKTGRRFRGKALEAAFDHKGELFQAGVLIPKRHVSQAVHRNQLRRKIFRAIPDHLKLRETLRLAVRVINEEATQLTEEEIRNFFEELVEMIGV